MEEEHIDLDKMMAELFGSTPVQEEQKFYLWYNDLKCIVAFGGQFLEQYKDYKHIVINEHWFEVLSNANLNNYIVDTTQNVPVDISGNELTKHVNLHKPGEWSERLVQLQFVKSTRQLHITVNTQLPSEKKLWVVPQGNYTVPLATLSLNSPRKDIIDIPTWQSSKSCECISEYPIDIFVAYREVENEKDL